MANKHTEFYSSIIFTPVPLEKRAFFEAIPWCRQYLDDPTLKPFTHASRHYYNEDNRHRTFMTKTLAGPERIAHWQSFYRPPAPESGNRFAEMFHLISLGPGLNGHIDKAHGGVISAILDDAMGTVAWDARDKDKIIFTLYLKVEYKQLVPTGGVILCRCWLDNEKTEGKKIYPYGTIEDGNGTVLATGEALFIQKEKPFEEARL